MIAFADFYYPEKESSVLKAQKSVSQLPCFLVISDIHLKQDKDQKQAYSDYGESGKDLWDSAKNKIDDVILKSYGLKNMRTRSHQINYTIEIRSETLKGTQLTLVSRRQAV